MKVKQGLDKEKAMQIAKECGAASVKNSISYITAPFISGKPLRWRSEHDND